MSKLWLVASYEYRRHVLQKRFILAMLSVPLIIALMIGMVALVTAIMTNKDAIGYVDHANFLQDPLSPPRPGGAPDEPGVPEPVPLIAFETEQAARQALDAKDIQAYYVIAPDFRESNAVDLVYYKKPGGNVQRQFWDFMQINQLRDLDPQIASRAVADSNLIVHVPSDSGGSAREFSQHTFLNIFVPLIIGFSFVFLLFSASGYLMGAVSEEKENRTMEIVMTSLSADQLMVGKVIGILGVTFTQLLGWVGFAALAVVVGGEYLHIQMLQNLVLDLRIVATTAAIALPAFIMLAGLMTAIGATVAETQEGQQVSGILVLPFMIPVYLLGILIEHPNSPLSVFLSLFPPTSVATFSIRLGFSQVPTWQIATSIAISSVCALASLWLAGRAFRLGMLRYGQRLKLAELLGTSREEGD